MQEVLGVPAAEREGVVQSAEAHCITRWAVSVAGNANVVGNQDN